MSNTYLFDKVSELKEKFAGFFQHRKKLKALQHYSEAAPFKHKNYLTAIKLCMNDGFLEKQEADFLDHMLNKYKVNYLDWSHKTKWLKKEMNRLVEQNSETTEQYTFFNPPTQRPIYNVPLELLAQQQKINPGRRIS